MAGWMDLLGAGLGAGAGIYGANQAANAMETAGKKAQQANLRNYLAALQLNEPMRNVGYQALGDLAGTLGYSVPAYTSGQQLQRGLTPISAKTVAQMLRSGFTLDQVMQQGSFSDFSPKSLKRLIKAGLTPDQISQLRAGPQSQAPAGGAATQQPAAGGAQGGGMDFSKFYDSPDYLFRQSEGAKAVNQSAAARGGALSGNALRALTQFNNNIASNEFNNWWNRRLSLANGGQQAVGMTQGAGNNYSNNTQQNAMYQGDARASGILAGAGAVQGLLQGLGNINWGGGGSPGLSGQSANNAFADINRMYGGNYLSGMV